MEMEHQYDFKVSVMLALLAGRPATTPVLTGVARGQIAAGKSERSDWIQRTWEEKK